MSFAETIETGRVNTDEAYAVFDGLALAPSRQ